MNNRNALVRRLPMLLSLILLFAGCAQGRSMIDLSSPQPAAASTSPKRHSEIRWVRYYEALSVYNRTKQNLIMLYFTRDSCDPCEMMEKWTFTDERVVHSMKDFIPVKIRSDIEIQMVQRFNVHTFPMIIFAEMEEGEVDRKAGYRTADFLLNWMEEVKANRATMRVLAQELETSPDDVSALLKQANNYLDADEVEAALKLAQKASDLAPANPSVPVLYGLCHLRTGALEEAEAAAASALQMDPQNEDARQLRIAVLLQKAEIKLRTEDYEGAIKTLTSILELDPNNFNARIGLGQASKGAGDSEKAFKEFQLAVAMRPDSSIPHVALGDLYRQDSDDAKAEKEYLRAVEIQPRYEAPYFRLMELYEKNGRRDDLLATYEKVSLLEPAGAHNEIAWLMATSKDPEIFNPVAAAKHAEAAIEIEPNPWYIDTLAEAYYAQGEHDLAIAIIKEAMAEKPDDLQYYQEQLEKFQKAKEEAGRKKTGENE